MKILRLMAATLFFSLSIIATADERVRTTSDTLLARIQVEDFLNDYYWELASEGVGDVSGFWTEDAVFDVNGELIEGLPAIEEVYSQGLGPGGRLVFQMNIPKIHIHENSATVDLIYTGILNRERTAAPKPYEQGHDHMELTHANGEWKIAKRVLRTFSLDESYGE